MRKILVAVCGAPMVGKGQIIRQISLHINASNVTVHATETERIVSLDVDWHGENIFLHTISGGMLYPDLSISKILMGANAVIYVVSSEQYQKDSQVRFFKHLSRQATVLNASWEDVPWIFVLNKTDVSQENPLLEYMPLSYQDKVISCIATKGQGISEIWDRLTALNFADT